MAIEEKKYLGSTGVETLIRFVKGQDETNLQDAKDYADGLAENYDAAGTAASKVQELAEGQVKTNTEHIGTMANLETTAKSDLVNAINEVRNAVSAGGTAAAITMEEKTSELGEGVAKAYVLKQGDNTVGTINIPKDMVVQSGEVVVNPAGQPAGTYIKLTLANATNDVIYVNVGTLVDIYKAKASAAQVQIAIDSATREISASIVAGSITATELAADAVTTVKIADGNVTTAKIADKAITGDKIALNSISTSHLTEGLVDEAYITDGAVSYDKLSDSVQTSIDEIADLVAKKHEHSNNAKLDTYDKTQTELLSAASSDAAAKASAAQSAAESAAAADATSKANTAESNAKSHADGLNTAMDTRVKALESVTYVEMTASEVQAIIDSIA